MKRALVVVAILACTKIAFAGPPSAADVATARELYKQGADALDAGNAPLAVEKLTAGWSLAKTPVIGTDLAMAHLKLGHLVEARESALAVMRLPVSPDETTRSTQARLAAEQLSDKLAARIPKLTINIDGLAGHDGTLTVDSNTVPLVAASAPRAMNPGAHRVAIVTDDARHAEVDVTLVEGKETPITLSLPAPKTNAQSTQEPPPHANPIALPPPEDRPQRAGTSPLVWIGVATTGVGLAVGAISGAFALAEASTVKQFCTGVGADKMNYCDPAHTGDLSAANTAGAIATVGFIAAGVGVAVLVTGFVVGGKKQTARLVPIVGPTFGVAGTF